MSDDTEMSLFRASEGETIKPSITHNLEIIKNSRGEYQQIYNYYDYVFTDLPDAKTVRVRVYFGERTASIADANPSDHPQAIKSVIAYFTRRMFNRVECLGGPAGGYYAVWERAK
jgi:hypothetical protein